MNHIHLASWLSNMFWCSNILCTWKEIISNLVCCCWWSNHCIITSFFSCWQLKLEGIHVDEEKTINDPELLMEVISFILTYMFDSEYGHHLPILYILSITVNKHCNDCDTVNFFIKHLLWSTKWTIPGLRWIQKQHK